MMVLHIVLLGCLSSVVGWVLYSWYCLFTNYLTACRIGVPLVIIPVSHENPLWMIVDKKIFIPLFERLPFGSGTFTRYNWRGWEFQDKNKSHLEKGDIFVVVTPGRNWLYLCNAEALLDVFQRRAEFPRPLELFEMVNVFGPNLSTTDGQQWQRHRKVTASCFNEQNNDLVWAESVRQARGMLNYWVLQKSIRSTADDTRTLSLHVLSSAGFGKSYPFQGHLEASPTNVATSYKESLQTILDNCILLMVLGQKFLSKNWLPQRLRKLHQATLTFKQYMTEVYEEEKRWIEDGKPGDSNLMTSLIRASAGANEAGESEGNCGALTESEIYGNIFVFNFAGHDTTAHTLAFAVVILAANPSVQKWLSEELQYVLGDKDPSEWDYQAVFPRLKRCLAVLYETLRLYPPVPIAKSTGREPRTLTVGNKSFVIPANTMLIPNHVAIHTHPRYWGHDCLVWRPSRWIQSGKGTNVATKSNLDNESIVMPHKGSFIAWSEGIRNCPGKKFSQIEFVATMAGLFKDWGVDPVPEGAENLDMARKRVMHMAETDTGQVLLLQLLHPERAALAWRRR
ncbi:hypothetical protein N7G274_008403 [Stereocaulon virgatum]|uniref:Cytochrome P450 n=1 Tax=Stereocaulon virgatum TaxID=373712 RepID=A0ABR4A1M5_9LECA